MAYGADIIAKVKIDIEDAKRKWYGLSADMKSRGREMSQSMSTHMKKMDSDAKHAATNISSHFNRMSLRTVAAMGAAAAGIGALFVQAIQKAGEAEDRWMQFNVALGRGALEWKKTQTEYGSVVSQTQKDTAQGQKVVLDVMNQLAVSGVRTPKMFQTSTEMITGMAFVSRKAGETQEGSINRVNNAYSRAIKSQTLQMRSMNMMGIRANVLNEVLKKHNLTKKDWQKLSEEGRASILNETMAIQGATEGNKSWADSYGGAYNKMQIAYGALQRAIGDVLLPYVIPAMFKLADIVYGIRDGFKALSPEWKSFILYAGLAVGGLMAFGAVAGVLFKVLGPIKQIKDGLSSITGKKHKVEFDCQAPCPTTQPGGGPPGTGTTTPWWQQLLPGPVSAAAGWALGKGKDIWSSISGWKMPGIGGGSVAGGLMFDPSRLGFPGPKGVTYGFEPLDWDVKIPEFKWPEFKMPELRIADWIKEKLKLPEFKWPEFKMPELRIAEWISDKLPPLNWDWFMGPVSAYAGGTGKPSFADDIKSILTDRIPEIKWPNISLGSIKDWVWEKISWLKFPSISWNNVKDWIWQHIGWLRFPSISWGSVRDWIWQHIGWLRFPSISWGSVRDWIWQHIGWLHFPSVGTIGGWIYNFLNQRIPFLKWSGPGGPAGPNSASNFLSMASGFRYVGYGGSRQSISETLGCMTGNCVDGTLAQLALAESFGIPSEMVLSSWGGNPHVYGRIAGRNRDISNYALTGSWNPPASGPTGLSGGVHLHFYAPVYGIDDFDKRVEKSMDKIQKEINCY